MRARDSKAWRRVRHAITHSLLIKIAIITHALLLNLHLVVGLAVCSKL